MSQRVPVVSSFILPLFSHSLLGLSLFSPGRLAPLLILLTLSYSFSTSTLAQTRPRLKPVSRDYFAGRFLFVPRDEKPSSLRQPDMIAEVADHYLITLPVRLLGNAEQIIDWVKNVDYDEIDGAILSLDAIAAGTQTGSAQRRLEFVRDIRSHRPGVPIYASVTLTGASSPMVESAIGLVAGGSLDLLLISSEGRSGDSQQKALLAGLKSDIESRKLGDRVRFNGDPGTSTISLLARMINSRFGFAPRIMPVYSSAAGREAAYRLVAGKIESSGGVELPQTSEAARNVDLLLFIHTAQTRDQERAAMVETIAQTIDRNVRIGLVDLSETKESREALIAGLRSRKLLDKLVTYAAYDPANENSGDAVTRSLAHALSFLASVRFLRDDLDRVRRFDRAQENLLIGRYLSDWIFPFQIRPKLSPYLSGHPEGGRPRLASKNELAENYALDQLKPLAEELFKDQFQRNTHSFLLSYGERAQFEVRLIQRLMLRLLWKPGSPQTAEVEIKPSIHLVHLGSEPVPQLRPRKLWEIRGDLDERVERRWEAVDWPGFKTDAESVQMEVKVSADSDLPSGADESYTILSKRSRSMRRIQIDAPSHRAAFYAIGKLERMGADGQLAQDFQISEKSAIEQRGMVESFSASPWSRGDRIEMLRFLGRLRMNRYYYFPGSASDPVKERSESPESEDAKIRELLRVADENFVQLVYGIRLAGEGSPSGLEDFASIESNLGRLIQLGIRRFAVCFNNAPADLQSGNYEARLKVIVARHSLMVRRIREYLRRSDDIELSVWPREIIGSRYGAEYLKKLAAEIPPDVRILVAAGTADAKEVEASRRIDLQSINRGVAIDRLGWDLCLGQGPGAPSAVSGKAADFTVLATHQLQLTRLMLAILAGYAWDGRGYNRERSIDSALNLLYDERARTGMRVWSQLIRGCQDRLDQVPLKIGELRSALDLIGGTREQGLLRGELARLID